ncbi:hypothetical protein [Candidatus Uabimicrobium sp. HlEnr_7]|uniref:hypothetical protein n=1 Tax=Candidatus Uabimicrobium helgolandensis TaxID=3095367 RepID=UPI003556DC1F
MITKNLYILFFILTFATSCLAPKKDIQVAGVYAYPEKEDNKEIYELIISLTSSNFFEYTQAARKLIKKGEDALAMLVKYKHLTREVDGINLVVCTSTIKIILKQQKTSWLEQRQKTAIPELQKFIQQEFKKRVNPSAKN